MRDQACVGSVARGRVGGIPLPRFFNSICYIIAGGALVVMSQLAGFPGDGSTALAIVIGLGAVAYGAKIMMTRTSYWVGSWVYLLAFGSVAAMFGLLAKWPGTAISG